MKQQLIINKQIAAAFLSLVVIGGLLMHDIKLGSVTSIAALSVASAAGYSALSHYSFDSGDHHIHVRSLFSTGGNSLEGGLSRLPNKSDSEKKYITQKRFVSGSSSNGEYYWPSI